MIDSVTIKIIDEQFVLFEPDEHFGKMKCQVFRGQYGVFGRYWVRHTDFARKEKKRGHYFPLVSVVYDERRKRRIGAKSNVRRWLLVQVSIPKLLYGTSLFDADERMLDLFAVKLQEQLRRVNLVVEPSAIKEAIIQRVDYSKILKISPTYGEPRKIIRELASFDYKPSSDFNLNTHHNGKDDEKGHYVKFYNSSQGLVIYDKLDEIDIKGTTKMEEEIRGQYRHGKFTKGALRIELSLQKKQTADSVLSRFIKGKKKDFTLREAFSSSISKALLKETFRKVYVEGFGGLMRLSRLKDAELYRHVKANVPNLKQRGIVYMLAHRVRDVGLKETIEELRSEVSSATLARYRSQVERLLGESSSAWDSANVIGYLRSKLDRFTPVLPENLKHMLPRAALVDSSQC